MAEKIKVIKDGRMIEIGLENSLEFRFYLKKVVEKIDQNELTEKDLLILENRLRNVINQL